MTTPTQSQTQAAAHTEEQIRSMLRAIDAYGQNSHPEAAQAISRLVAPLITASYATQRTIESAARDLEFIADMIETGPAPKPETLRALAKAYRTALANSQTKEGQP